MDKIRVLSEFDDVTVTPAFAPYTRATVVVNEDLSYTAGDDSGRTLTVKCPWGTQQIANDLLRQYQGYRYQPFDASGLIIDQAAELGDGIQVGRAVYSGLYSQDIDFSSLPKSSASAPQSEEIDHEFPFKPEIDREYTRQYHETKATLKVQAGLISAEVQARTAADTELSGRIDTEAGRITAEVAARGEAVKAINLTLDAQKAEISAKVSQTGGAEDGSFSYEMKPTFVEFKANSVSVLKLDKTGGKFTGDIEAENGYFHGTVYAGKIIAGVQPDQTDAGYLDGSGIKSGTITGGQNGEISTGTLEAINIKSNTITNAEVAKNTLGTSVFQNGVNTSLGYADMAGSVIGPHEDKGYQVNAYIGLFNVLTISGKYLSINGKTLQIKSKTIAGTTITYLGV